MQHENKIVTILSKESTQHTAPNKMVTGERGGYIRGTNVLLVRELVTLIGKVFTIINRVPASGGIDDPVPGRRQ